MVGCIVLDLSPRKRGRQAATRRGRRAPRLDYSVHFGSGEGPPLTQAERNRAYELKKRAEKAFADARAATDVATIVERAFDAAVAVYDIERILAEGPGRGYEAMYYWDEVADLLDRSGILAGKNFKHAWQRKELIVRAMEASMESGIVSTEAKSLFNSFKNHPNHGPHDYGQYMQAADLANGAAKQADESVQWAVNAALARATTKFRSARGQRKAWLETVEPMREEYDDLIREFVAAVANAVNCPPYFCLFSMVLPPVKDERTLLLSVSGSNIKELTQAGFSVEELREFFTKGVQGEAQAMDAEEIVWAIDDERRLQYDKRSGKWECILEK